MQKKQPTPRTPQSKKRPRKFRGRMISRFTKRINQVNQQGRLHSWLAHPRS
jgi:hypothetical protein